MEFDVSYLRLITGWAKWGSAINLDPNFLYVLLHGPFGGEKKKMHVAFWKSIVFVLKKRFFLKISVYHSFFLLFVELLSKLFPSVFSSFATMIRKVS